jgi:hypothetical protein
MTGDIHRLRCEGADHEARLETLAEIEIRLESIVASAREIAARAEEHLREATVAPPGDSTQIPHFTSINHIPFVIEASRLQISALHALMGQGQRIAA